MLPKLNSLGATAHSSSVFVKKKFSQTSPKDDYAEKAKTGPVITLHSTEDSQQVDEIHMHSRGKDSRPQPAEEYVAGYKVSSNCNRKTSFMLLLLLVVVKLMMVFLSVC